MSSDQFHTFPSNSYEILKILYLADYSHVSQVYFMFFRNGWMDCRDAFHGVLYVLYIATYVTDKT